MTSSINLFRVIKGDIIGAEFKDFVFGFIDITASRLQRCSFINCSITGITARNSYINTSEFIDCDLRGADFRGAHLQNTIMLRCKVDGADFRGAIFNQCNLRDINFPDAITDPFEIVVEN